MKGSVLLVDDDRLLLSVLKSAVEQMGYQVRTADGGSQALDILQGCAVDILLVDLNMPELDGFDVMQFAIKNHRAKAVLIMTGQNEGRVGARAIQAGAADFIAKPFEPSELEMIFEQVLDGDRQKEQRHHSLQNWHQAYASQIIGQDPRLLQVLDMSRRVAETECEVLITGESGSGKELFAKAIHAASSRASGPFVTVNCAAIPKELMESEIFGHVKGAFTGAIEARQGKFEAADGGTLFLDEIGEMDITLQAKFLRIIQEKEFTPIGASRSKRADVRILSATNRDLRAECDAHRFREDLYFRINVVPITLPPLRERKEDILLLTEHFIQQCNARHERQVLGIDDEVLAVFQSYSWPGNVRELRNLVERLVVLKSDRGPLTRDDLPDFLLESGRMPVPSLKVSLPESGIDINTALMQLEQQLTLDALSRTGGNKAKAAALLGLKRTTLIERLKRFH